ncbi:hypothetical protein ACMA5K_20475 [Bradyrhizobium diazoefficiens]|uniref:hypothetical protein n=1 Tax=Bradyrhizobium diazoefficiens TaxID=1355477 RepID=UPI0015B3924E|nr:hypothetical protein [Bradyrhizobium diazoefficiens]QLD43186.1 hypothetical protein HUW42_20310 [Bradyrhizobium diazoefficiens]
MDAKNSSTSDAIWIEINGSTEIGSIGADVAKAIGFPEGCIRLAEGLPGPKGYGLAHVRDNHDRVSDLKNIGFAGAQAAIVEVAANWDVIVRANQPKRVVLVRRHRARCLSLVVQIYNTSTGYIWSVVTVFIGPRIKAADVIYERKITAG